MSASDISDALITNLGAASVLGSTQVDSHYKILETTSACCAVVSFLGSVETPSTFGAGSWESRFTHTIEWYVKDKSNNVLTIENEIQATVDISVCSLRSDPSLQTAASTNIRRIDEMRIAHDIQTVATAGGATWYVATGEIDTVEFIQ